MSKSPPSPRPTDAELAILEVLWQRGASTVREVHEALPERQTGYTTVLKLMQIMVDKRLLARDEAQRSHVYSALVDRERTRRRLVAELCDKVFGGSAAELVMHALSEKATPAELAEDPGHPRRLRGEAGGAMMAPSIVVHALALTLLHSLWQGAVVALALGLALRALRRAAPEARYLVACAALSALLVAPVLTFASIHRALGAAPRAIAALPPLGAAPLHAYVPLLVSAAWAAGVSLMLLRLAGGHLRVRRLVAESTPVGADLTAVLARLAARVGVRRDVELRASDALTVPAVAGWLRPVVLLPVAAVSRLSPSAIEAILAHELAHVRRHDYLVNALQSAAEALLFYHPAAWWVSRVIRAEREHASDDRAVAVLDNPLGYARALAAAEALRSPVPTLGVAFTGGSLMSRVRRLLSSPPPNRRAPLALVLAAAVVALGACTAVVSGDGEGRPALSIPALPEAVARWAPELSAAGARHGVDPDLLAVVTLVESGGDPDARSPAGALGLMQIMPATGEKIAAARGLAGPSEARLRDPAYNVDMGAWYLAQQLHDFADADPDRTVALAAAAYNAGPDAVRASLAGGAPLPDETTRYQAKVTALWRARHAVR